MFKKIDRTQLEINPFTSIGDDWTLITAKKDDTINTMTASWGEIGHLWNEDVITVFIRPQRYTKQFVDAAGKFSLSIFKGYKKELGYLGRVSGKDEDKISTVNFHPIELDGIPTFEEANIVINGKILYADELKEENFFDKEIVKLDYPLSDYHTVYVAKVTGIYVHE